MLRHALPTLAATLLLTLTPVAHAQPVGGSVDKLLHDSFSRVTGDGSLAHAATTLEVVLAEQPDNNDALAALGVVQFLQSGERLLQRVHTHGGFNLPLQGAMMTGMPGNQLSLLFNPNPQPIDYPTFRAEIQDWIDDVARAEATLARVADEPLKVRFPIGLPRFDLNNNGNHTADEQLWRVFTAVQQRFDPDQAGANTYVIALDRGDVAWLRGYAHLCMAAGEFFLAHDSQDLFERTGHVFFAKNESPHEQLKGLRRVFDPGAGVDATDLVALVHLLSFEPVEPQRLLVAREHLLQTLTLGHEMWSWYDAETDDEQEWIPNPAQANTAIPGALMTEARRDVWLRALTEATDLLEGRRVARFWRGNNATGINIQRVFTEPRRFDLILWIQGSAATPYLEEGEFTSDDLWRDLETAFDQGVFRYMWWLN